MAALAKTGGEISDRAHRYRWHRQPPPGPRRCALCGSDRFLVGDHKDGDEWNDRQSNKRWLCKSCNTKLGAQMVKEGKGRRTRQYNAGAKTLGQYIAAVVSHGRGRHDAGGSVIHDTPKAKRQEFAEEIWKLRKRRGNPTRYEHDDIAKVPAGHKVRTITHASGVKVRVAFPRGRRKKGAGQVVSILTPKSNPIDMLTPFMGGAAMMAGQHAARAVANALASSKNTRRRRRNSAESEAAEAYTEFHGRSPSKVYEYQEQLQKSGDYYALGHMGSLWLSPVKGKPESWPAAEIRWSRKEDVHAACDPAGTQIFFMHGDQDLNLGDRGLLRLGTCYAIGYVTQKVFDKYQTHEYCHRFGDEGGKPPVLWYDATNKRVLLVGGTYAIAPLEPGMGASPGIRN